MANEVRLLVTQALDERDLLNKKINDKLKRLEERLNTNENISK